MWATQLSNNEMRSWECYVGSEYTFLVQGRREVEYRRQSSLLESLQRLNSKDIKTALDELTGKIVYRNPSPPLISHYQGY